MENMPKPSASGWVTIPRPEREHRQRTHADTRPAPDSQIHFASPMAPRRHLDLGVTPWLEASSEQDQDGQMRSVATGFRRSESTWQSTRRFATAGS